MIKISICICTRKRQEGLRKVLDSLEIMQIPGQTIIKFVIIENDIENFSEDIVNSTAAKSKFTISYHLEKSQGLAYARNRSVKEAGECDFCCFIDDDQMVASDWFMELFKCQEEFDADGVYGCTVPYFNKDVPSYIRMNHERDKHDYGTILQSAATGGLLLRKKYLDMIEGPFDIRFNYIGGEDSHLTNMITNAGGIIRYTPNAIAYEAIPENRTTIKYIIRRIYRISNSRLIRKSLLTNNVTVFNTLPRLLVRFFYGVLIFVPFYFFGKANKLKGLLKISDAIGGMVYFFGKRDEFYK